MAKKFDRVDLYSITEDMVHFAREERKEDLLRWNKGFSNVAREVFNNPLNHIDYLYADCRNTSMTLVRKNLQGEEKIRFYRVLEEKFKKIPFPSLI